MSSPLPATDSAKERSLRRPILHLTLVMLFILTVLSVISAFLGAEKATAFFSSPPLILYWLALIALFCGGIALLPNLRKKPALLLSHLGCVLVLLGAIWGSESAHTLRNRLFQTNKLHHGYLLVSEGQQTNTVIDADGTTVIGTLPFAIQLRDFWIEYYMQEGVLKITTPDGKRTTLEAIAGNRTSWGPELPQLRISRVFRNFKISIEERVKSVTDQPGGGINPALEVDITSPDGSTVTRYVFPENMQYHQLASDGIDLAFRNATPSGISDFKSHLAVIQDDKTTKEQVIEVNSPLNHGGYGFYQFDYDQENGSYTVLSVSSNSGLILVYTGYAMMCLGVMWQCWFRHLPGYLRRSE